jgi:hypothetical protein
MANRPTLLNSCSWAATAAEARFRINAPRPAARSTRVVALDAGAAPIVAQLAGQSWGGARFFNYGGANGTAERDSELADLVLSFVDGSDTRLSEQLVDADAMVMVATADDGAAAASAIGNACTLRGIMTAGLILGTGQRAGAAVTALRPHARVLLVSNDQFDLSEVLAAIGA